MKKNYNINQLPVDPPMIVVPGQIRREAAAGILFPASFECEPVTI